MYSLEQANHLRADSPASRSLQMGQLEGARPERQPTDRCDRSGLYPCGCSGVKRETQFADAAPPEVQALG